MQENYSRPGVEPGLPTQDDDYQPDIDGFEPDPPTWREASLDQSIALIESGASPDSNLYRLDMAFRVLDGLGKSYGPLSESEHDAVLGAIARLRADGFRRGMPDWFDDGLRAFAGVFIWRASRPQQAKPAGREARRDWPPPWVWDADARFRIAANEVRNARLRQDIEDRRQEAREARLRDGLKAVG